ncbi:MAG: hypothetical protein QM811_21990 [Pirellulales bacterium]
MIRKVLLLGVIGLLGAGALFGKHACSYFSTAAGWARDGVKDAIPMDFEIDRARQMARDLMPEIKKNMQTIAREEVAIAQLKQQAGAVEDKLAKDRDDLGKLRGDLASNKNDFRYGGRTYTVSQVKADLGRRLERCKTNDATLNSLQDMLAAHEKGLTAAREKLDAMLSAKRQLEADVENLQARLKMVEVAQTASSANLDDSQLGRVKELVSELQGRLQVAEKLAQAEAAPLGEIPVSQDEAVDILDRVTEYLGGGKDDIKVASHE